MAQQLDFPRRGLDCLFRECRFDSEGRGVEQSKLMRYHAKTFSCSGWAKILRSYVNQPLLDGVCRRGAANYAKA